MKPHPRIRKTIKWTGAAVTVLLVVLWIEGGWWLHYWYASDGRYVCIGAGQLGVGRSSHYAGLGIVNLHTSRTVRPFLVWLPGWNGKPLVSSVLIPLWLPVGITLTATIFAWRLDTLARRRALLNLCSKCNYDRAGIAKDAVCPECGSKAGPA